MTTSETPKANKTSQAAKEQYGWMEQNLRYLEIPNELVAILAKYQRMEEALKALYDWLGLCDSSENETFERIGEMFYADTRFLRPGKSEPAAIYSEDRERRRREAWDAWCQKKTDELNEKIREALAYDPLSQ